MSVNNVISTSYNFKVVLLGEGCVGKTSLVLRYIEDKFNSQHISTLQASFVTKKITLPNGQRAQLNIWDTAGQERFHALGPIYYRGSQGAILVYDITDQDSFQKVKNWVRELKRMLGPEITITIVGNKTDLESDRNVSYEDAVEYSQSVGAHYFETSAKLNEGVKELFDMLSRLMADRRDAQREREPNDSLAMHGGRRGIILEDSLDDDSLHGGERHRLGSVGSGDDDNRDTTSPQRFCCGTG